MRTRSSKRLGWSAAWALALVFGAPVLATAQTTELFPFRRITRERVPCAMEDPVYKLYRNEYYGYHPTCWRKFPTGWGCPSPEGPNAAEAFRILPRDKPDMGEPMGENNGMDDAGRGPADAGDRPARGNRPELPPLPAGERSPFEIEPAPTTPPAADPVAPKPAAENPPEGGAGLPPATEPEANAPAPPPATRDRRDRDVENVQPLLALPDPTVAPSSGVVNGGPGPDAAVGPLPALAPARAPRRTSLLGNLFSGIRRR